MTIDRPVMTEGRNEQRQHPRHQLRTNGVLRMQGRADMRVRVLDASIAGCGIEHDDPIGVPGARGQLQLAAPDNAARVGLTLSVVLRYSILKGTSISSGLAFVDLSAVQDIQLAALLSTQPTR